ncbi:MAG: SPW repeat protein [Actinobacteria bacterium]|nr:SPW repeat protein [Actinomycetota bacterium]
MRPEWAQLEGERESSVKQPVLRAVDCLMFLAGLYLAVSPWVVGFNGMVTLSVNNLIVGAALAMLALRFSSAGRRAVGVAGAVPVIGAWTIIAPWVVSGNVATTASIWSNVVTGVIAALTGLAAMSLRTTRIH